MSGIFAMSRAVALFPGCLSHAFSERNSDLNGHLRAACVPPQPGRVMAVPHCGASRGPRCSPLSHSCSASVPGPPSCFRLSLGIGGADTLIADRDSSPSTISHNRGHASLPEGLLVLRPCIPSQSNPQAPSLPQILP